MTHVLPFETTPAASDLGRVAERRLRASPYFFLKSIRCEYAAGVVTLRGNVPLEPLKQFAESIVARIDGVRGIDNQLHVRDPFTARPDAPAARSA